MIPALATKTVGIVFPQAIKDNTEFVGSKGSTPVELDTAGWDHVDIFVMFGAMDIKMATMKLWACDTLGGAYAAVTGGDFGSPDALPTATDDNHLFAWHINKLSSLARRFYEVELIPGDGAAGTYAVCWAVLSRGAQEPKSAAARGLTTELFIPANP